jgi:hypothetical protein
LATQRCSRSLCSSQGSRPWIPHPACPDWPAGSGAGRAPGPAPGRAMWRDPKPSRVPPPCRAGRSLKAQQCVRPGPTPVRRSTPATMVAGSTGRPPFGPDRVASDRRRGATGA